MMPHEFYFHRTQFGECFAFVWVIFAIFSSSAISASSEEYRKGRNEQIAEFVVVDRSSISNAQSAIVLAVAFLQGRNLLKDDVKIEAKRHDASTVDVSFTTVEGRGETIALVRVGEINLIDSVRIISMTNQPAGKIGSELSSLPRDRAITSACVFMKEMNLLGSAFILGCREREKNAYAVDFTRLSASMHPTSTVYIRDTELQFILAH